MFPIQSLGVECKVCMSHVGGLRWQNLFLEIVESAIASQNRDYQPLTPRHINESTQLFGTKDNSSTEFSVGSPTWTNTSGFEQSVQVRTDAKSESGLVDGFPSMNISPGRDPYTIFTTFLVSCLVSGLLPCSYRHLHSTMLMMWKSEHLRIQDHIF